MVIPHARSVYEHLGQKFIFVLFFDYSDFDTEYGIIGKIVNSK